MVSPPHEAMHRIFQHDPGLFSRVSRYLGVDIPRPTKAAVLPADHTETRPVERRVDTLLRFETEAEGPFLLAIESQGKRDVEKPASWAYYTAYLWTKYRLPTALLVVCQDHATAAWAQRAVSSGPPQLPTLTLRPVVAGPHNMPVITDPEEARARPRPGQPGGHHTRRRTMCRCDTEGPCPPHCGTRPRTSRTPSSNSPHRGLGKYPAKHVWRNLVAVDLSFYKSYLVEEIREEARAEARAEGRAEDVLLVLEQRGLDISDAVRSRVTECGDPEVLRSWLARAVTVPKAEEIFEDE